MTSLPILQVARAMLALLTAALEDPAVQFIYLGTESCVPCRSFPETVDVLWAKGPKSWLDMWEEDPPEGYFDCYVFFLMCASLIHHASFVLLLFASTF